MQNLYINLARKALQYYFKTQQILKVPSGLPTDLLQKKAGVFVSLHNKNNNDLRGCIGTFLPTKNNIAEEIINNAISAAIDDHRFYPVEEKELDNLNISVDVLSELEKVTKIKELDPKKYGIYIKTNDGRSALLLPDLGGIDTIEQQLQITRQKGGILADESITIYKFHVTRHKYDS